MRTASESPVPVVEDSCPDRALQNGKRETLTSRAKRVIGRTLDSPKEKNKNLSGKKGPPKKEPNRRREQVLQAQRTHRQRTQGYIRELEKEVLRLRGREVELQKLNVELSRRNKELEHRFLGGSPLTLTNGIASPAGPSPFGFGLELQHHSPFMSTDGDLTSGPSEGGLTPSLVHSDTETTTATPINFPTEPNTDPFVKVDFTSMANVELVHICNSDQEWLMPKVFESPKRTDVVPMKLDTTKSDFPSLNSQQALNFVLDLEAVCFPHIAYDQINQQPSEPEIPETNHGHNHVYSATTNLINRRLPKDPRTEVFQFPKPDLDRLFSSSLHVNFGADVTPIQIWANLMRISGLGYVIGSDFVAILTEELKRYVRCNGYGAVIEKNTISALFEFYFPGQQYLIDWEVEKS